MFGAGLLNNVVKAFEIFRSGEKFGLKEF